MICSLTRTAAAEAAGRVKIDRKMVGTLHAHAYRALGHPKIVSKTEYTEWNELYPYWQISEGTSIDEPEWEQTENSTYNQYQLAKARMSDDYDLDFAAAWTEFKQDREILDFSDLIEIAFETVDYAPNDPRVIIADEAQDMSKAEFALLRKWGAAAEAIILVGDPYQALYTWRGANPDFLLKHEVPEGHRDVLSQSYRVPSAVHKVATDWLRSEINDYKPVEYQARSGSDGDVISMGEANWRRPEAAIIEAENQLDRGGCSVMILAACGYMLKPTIAYLKENGIPFSNPWRRKRGDWNPLARGIGKRFLDFRSFLNDLRNDKPMSLSWVEIVRAKGLLLHGAKEKIKNRDSSLPVYEYELYDLFDYDEIQNLKTTTNEIDWFESHLLSTKCDSAEYPLRVGREKGDEALRKEPSLYIGTIHSFKGAEADTVIIYPDLSSAAFLEWRDQGAGHDNVTRLFYVALTRARQSVIVTSPAGRMYVELENYV